MPYFLALDVGGTNATYVLGDRSQVVARTRTGCIKRMRVDALTAEKHLEEGLASLAAQSGIPLSQVTHTCVGTAGETVPLVADWLRSEIGARVSGGMTLLGDVEIALDAAFPGGAGVLALAGTGSNVAGRAPGGPVSTCGGYGPVAADQGSGHRVGLRAMRAAFLAQDEDRSTTLLPALLAHWGLRSLEEMIGFVNAAPGPDFSKLSPLVLRCAHEGDVIAREVLAGEGEDLAYLVRLMVRRLQKYVGDTGFVPGIAFAGSVMEHVLPVREALLAAVREEFPTALEVPGVVDPVMGALWRARHA